MRRHMVMGILAHVDAGKTTLAEALLYETGAIRGMGRVDHGDSFLDTDAMERERGITIFAKQAELTLSEDWEMTLLDTPGHVDFAAETERTLQVLDAAILVISGADGVQPHDLTLWKLLQKHGIPVFLFVNKMDRPGTERGKLLAELQHRFADSVVDMTERHTEAWMEHAAMCEEALLERYLERMGKKRKDPAVTEEEAAGLVQNRLMFPCVFGSALRMKGITELVQVITAYAGQRNLKQDFGARVYKIGRDENGQRLTQLKVTGGILQVKQMLGTEKADQLRIYSGSQARTVTQVEAGQICAVLGPQNTYAGQGFGAEGEGMPPSLMPVIGYRLVLPEGSDLHTAYKRLLELQEELPELHAASKQTGAGAQELQIQVMGEVQLQVLSRMIEKRLGMTPVFDEGSILYLETIKKPVVGIGHYEPLRHYGEVQLILEPGERGSGIQFASACSEDVLDRNWQRLIFTHLMEKKHLGVLIGAPLTDVRVTLLAGRVHPKHTEGGDLREATYRALRQGLMCAESVLLEPVYAYELTLPAEQAGRAMTDLERKGAVMAEPEQHADGMLVLRGRVPVAAMHGYALAVHAYTHGTGRLQLTVAGYEPCQSAEQVIAEKAYEPLRDPANPAGSVFCAHGAGYSVPWDAVPSYAHIDTAQVLRRTGLGEQMGLLPEREETEPEAYDSRRTAYDEPFISQEEIAEIFARTFGNRALDKNPWNRGNTGGTRVRNFDAAQEPVKMRKKTETPKEKLLLVDGYNIIFAWQELTELAKVNLESARGRLMDILCNYQGYRGIAVLVVFDGYQVPGGLGESMTYHNISVVYTKESETADMYIEKLVHDKIGTYEITVATSDGLEQLTIMSQGARRMSARELYFEIEKTNEEVRAHL